MDSSLYLPQTRHNKLIKAALLNKISRLEKLQIRPFVDQVLQLLATKVIVQKPHKISIIFIRLKKHQMCQWQKRRGQCLKISQEHKVKLTSITIRTNDRQLISKI